MNVTVKRIRHLSSAIAVALLAACVPATSSVTSAPEPAQCTDPSYLGLRQQNPDSLSERAWQRLQTLDRECADARAQVSRVESAPGSRDTRHGTGHMMGMGIVATIIMAAMAISMW